MALLTHFDSLDLLDNLVKTVFQPLTYDPQHKAEGGWRETSRLIRMDVVESDDAYRILAELPGVKKEDVNVNIDGNRVLLSAQSKTENVVNAENERVLSRERFFGDLRRTIQLPAEIDDQQAQARYADGVLELSLPKKKNGGAKRLEIS